MKNNQVILSLEDYNGLRDFEREIEKGNTFRLWTGWGEELKYISTDETVKEISEINKKLSAEIIELKHKDKSKLKTFNDIKKMSIWQFIKWRKS